MITFVFYLILLFNFQQIFTDYITYPLIKIKNEPLNDDIKSSIYSELFNTYYLIRINISNNNSVDCRIISDEIDLSINETVNNYSLKSSLTLEKESEIFSDIFPFNKKNINDTPSITEIRLNFSLINSTNNLCEIGIGRPGYFDDKSKNLISQLKILNVTNSYVFTFNYNKNYFRFGDLPEFTHPEKYKEEDFYYTYKHSYLYDYVFFLEFHKLILISESQNEEKEFVPTLSYLSGQIEFGNNYMISTNNFKKFILKEFFNNYTDLCKEEIITYQNEQYSTFLCENKDNLKKNFPLIALYHKELAMNFTFNSDDLFTEIKSGKYLFNIIFPIKEVFHWHFGGVFIRKYQLFLNINNYKISYYNGKYTEETNILDGKSKNYLILEIIIITVLFCTIFVLGYFLGKRIYKKKMKEANELLDDNYDYSNNLKIND